MTIDELKNDLVGALLLFLAGWLAYKMSKFYYNDPGKHDWKRVGYNWPTLYLGIFAITLGIIVTVCDLYKFLHDGKMAEIRLEENILIKVGIVFGIPLVELFVFMFLFKVWTNRDKIMKKLKKLGIKDKKKKK